MQFHFKIMSSLAGLMLLASGLVLGARAQERAVGDEVASVPGELLVRWKSQRAPLVLAPSTDPSRWQQSGLSSQLGSRLPGSRLKRVFAASGWSVVAVPAGQSTQAARAALVKSLGAANVSLNYFRYATKIPNDPSYGTQWQWPKIQAPDAWNKGTGSRDVVIAVLDSGVDLNHADLRDNLWKNPGEVAGNGIDDDRNGYTDDVFGLNGIDPNTPPQDDFGHGTHVAGLVGAVGNNGAGVAGVNWGVKIMALRFLDSEGSGSDDDAIACFEYAIKMKQRGINLRVISNSYAGPEDNPAFKEAYQAAERAGILQVCASGNDGANNDVAPQYPASYLTNTNVSVAASDQNDGIAGYSNFGARSVDIAAPGTSISSLQNGGGTSVNSGTSMATPIVAGAAALISSLEPGLPASALKARLLATADKIPGLGGKVASGGRLNLARAVGYVAPIPHEIKGQVYRLSGTTRLPLAGAIVFASGKAALSTVADSNGNFRFANLAPGTYNLGASIQGYTFTAATRTFPQPGGGASATVDMLGRAQTATVYALFGVARDAAGVGRGGISIVNSAAPQITLAVTDSAGKYAIQNRAAGTYSLRASGAGFNWSATPASISVPQSAVAGRAEVNFRVVVPDTSAPTISITAPAEGSTLAPGVREARGIARDATGNKEVYLQLSRFDGFTRFYYNWTTRTWSADAGGATIVTRAASGKEAIWSLILPNLTPAPYSLRVWARDSLDNVSRGEADAFASFSVIQPAAGSANSS